MLLRAEYPFIIFATNKLLSSQKLIMCGTCAASRRGRRRHIRFESLKYLRSYGVCSIFFDRPRKKKLKEEYKYTNNRYINVINSCTCGSSISILFVNARCGANANLLKCLSHFLLSLFTMCVYKRMKDLFS